MAGARWLQENLIERGVLAAAGLVLDRLLGNRVGRGADPRLDRDARSIELLRDDLQIERLARREGQIGSGTGFPRHGDDRGDGFESRLLADDGVGAGRDLAED